MTSLSQKIGRNIRLFRKRKGLSVPQLASAIGKSAPTVYKYESGDIAIDTDTLFAIADHLGISPYLLIGVSDQDANAGSLPSGSFFNTGKLYGYGYDGRVGRIVQSLLFFRCLRFGNEVQDESCRENRDKEQHTADVFRVIISAQ